VRAGGGEERVEEGGDVGAGEVRGVGEVREGVMREEGRR